jgi:hypothetical protein
MCLSLMSVRSLFPPSLCKRSELLIRQSLEKQQMLKSMFPSQTIRLLVLENRKRN